MTSFSQQWTMNLRRDQNFTLKVIRLLKVIFTSVIAEYNSVQKASFSNLSFQISLFCSINLEIRMKEQSQLKNPDETTIYLKNKKIH